MDETELQMSGSPNAVPDENPDALEHNQSSDKSEKNQFSLYECPTAACSIISSSGQQDVSSGLRGSLSHLFSLDGSENETSVDASEEASGRPTGLKPGLPPHLRDINAGALPYADATQVTGGFEDRSEGILVRGRATLTESPRKFIPHTPVVNTPVDRFTTTNVRSVVMPHVSASSTPLRTPAQETCPGGGLPSASTSVPQTPTMMQESPMSRVTMPNSVNVTSPAVKDYSRAVDFGNTSETSFVHEGYDTIQVPRYRPVEIVEKTVEVPVVHHVDTYVPKKEVQEIESFVRKPYIKYVDKVVDVPEIHYNDTIVEVPEYHEVTKTVQKVEIQERIKYVPKVEVRVVPKYVEVPVVKIVDKYEEYEEVEEVIKHVEKVEIVEVPREVVKHVVKPVKKIIEQERIIPVIQHRDVPVEKVKLVPKIENVELLREVPNIVDVPVPYNVFKVEYVDKPYAVPEYRDVPVAVPVRKTVTPIYHYQGEPEVVDVPIHRPYLVIHDHISFKPASQPIGENIRVVGSRPVDLGTLSEVERSDAEERMKGIAKERKLPMDQQATAVTQQYQIDQLHPNALKLGENHQPFAAQSTYHPLVRSPRQMELTVNDSFSYPEFLFPEPSKSPKGDITKAKPVETFIYRNTPRSVFPPMQDGTQGDTYPLSATPTPRMGF